MIRTNGLTKRFGETLAVGSLDLEVKPGQIFGFLGPTPLPLGDGESFSMRLPVPANLGCSTTEPRSG